MSGEVSPGTGRRYPLSLVCSVYRVARSSVYAGCGSVPHEAAGRTAGPRGPRPVVADEVLLPRICAVIAASPFHGEGYRKVWARLRHGDAPLLVSKRRVLGLMRRHQLLAPTRDGTPHGPQAHDGTITTDAPNVMWGTDGTRFFTAQDGWCWLFTAVDHHTSEIVGHYVTKRGDRFAALEAVNRGVRQVFGAIAKDAAAGLVLRHDHGSQYTARDFQAGLAFVGMQSSPSYVREPQGNGIAEQKFRTLKEQCLYLHTFDTVEEAAAIIAAFVEQHNEQWLLGRLGYRTPAAVRRAFAQRAA
jgi:putative transposase